MRKYILTALPVLAGVVLCVGISCIDTVSCGDYTGEATSARQCGQMNRDAGCPTAGVYYYDVGECWCECN